MFGYAEEEEGKLGGPAHIKERNPWAGLRQEEVGEEDRGPHSTDRPSLFLALAVSNTVCFFSVFFRLSFLFCVLRFAGYRLLQRPKVFASLGWLVGCGCGCHNDKSTPLY